MKKFAAWLMVLAVGTFIVGCGEGDKPKPKDGGAKPADTGKPAGDDKDK